MLPVIALVGRPNVGKSTLFNRLTRSRDALVADMSGLTRDRKYGEACIDEKPFIVVDTGGISGFEEGIDSHMAEQSLSAIEEADIVLFLVDARAGRTAADEMIAQQLRVRSKKTFLVANKVDGIDETYVSPEFASLGLGETLNIAASHGRGVLSLMSGVLADIPPSNLDAGIKPRGTRIGIIGRPNVGKSTLVNRLLGEDRVVVYDEAGTTRDSIYIPYVRNEQDYTLIDTAGVRRRKNVADFVEKFSIIKTLQAIKDSNVVVVVLDAREGVVEQDLHLLGFALEAGRSLVIAVNKWDGMSKDDKDDVKRELDRRFVFVPYAKIHFISAMHGTGVGHLYESIDAAYESSMRKLSTNQLTRILEDAVEEHNPPMINGRRIKLRYAHSGGSNPPRIIIHGNQTEKLPGAYKKYLENTFRRVLKMEGTPIHFEFKTGKNPFEGKKNKLTQQQQSKQRRLTENMKKRKEKKKK